MVFRTCRSGLDLPVTNGVQPRPSEGRVTTLQTCRNGEVVGVQAVDAVGPGIAALDRDGKIALCIGRATTLHRVDHVPVGRVLLGLVVAAVVDA